MSVGVASAEMTASPAAPLSEARKLAIFLQLQRTSQLVYHAYLTIVRVTGWNMFTSSNRFQQAQLVFQLH